MKTATKKAPKTSPEIVTDFDILAVITNRRQVEQTELELAERRKQLAASEANLTTKLKGAHIFDGACRAQLNISSTTVSGKFAPSYKEAYIGHMIGVHGYDQDRLDAALRDAYPVTNKVVTTTELIVSAPE